MKRSNTIGFDARYANTGNSTLSSYARLIIEAVADACPRHSYFRLYITDRDRNAEYEALTRRHNVESMAPDGGLWRKLAWLWRQRAIGRDMERGDVELYHSLTDSLPYGLARRNIRTVVTIHGVDYLNPRIAYNPLRKLFRRWFMASALHRADRVVALSNALKQRVINIFGIDPDKVDVIYRSCHPRFAEEIAAEQQRRVKESYALPERFVLAAGAQTPLKNTVTIVEALPLLPEDVHLVIAGDRTPYTDHLRRRAKTLGVAERMHVVEGITSDDIAAFYSLAEMYILLSESESFATTIVEALTVGRPVIAAKDTAAREAGGDAAIYVDPNDAEALASTIDMLLEDGDLCAAMVAKGREQIRRFRPEVIAYNTLNCYRRIGIDIRE